MWIFPVRSKFSGLKISVSFIVICSFLSAGNFSLSIIFVIFFPSRTNSFSLCPKMTIKNRQEEHWVLCSLDLILRPGRLIALYSDRSLGLGPIWLISVCISSLSKNFPSNQQLQGQKSCRFIAREHWECFYLIKVLDFHTNCFHVALWQNLWSLEIPGKLFLTWVYSLFYVEDPRFTTRAKKCN